MDKKEMAQTFAGIMVLVASIIDTIISIILIIGGHYITGGAVLLTAVMFLATWFLAIYYTIKFPED